MKFNISYEAIIWYITLGMGILFFLARRSSSLIERMSFEVKPSGGLLMHFLLQQIFKITKIKRD